MRAVREKRKTHLLVHVSDLSRLCAEKIGGACGGMEASDKGAKQGWGIMETFAFYDADSDPTKAGRGLETGS